MIFIFTLYFGNNGLTYVFVNELAEPFVVGLGFAVSWGLRSVLGLLIPIIYDNLELYWTPMIMSFTGITFWFLFKPLYVEARGKDYVQISYEYANFKYDIKKSLYF